MNKQEARRHAAKVLASCAREIAQAEILGLAPDDAARVRAAVAKFATELERRSAGRRTKATRIPPISPGQLSLLEFGEPL